MLFDETVRKVQGIVRRAGRALTVQEILAEFPQEERRAVSNSLASMISPGYIQITRDLKVIVSEDVLNA